MTTDRDVMKAKQDAAEARRLLDNPVFIRAIDEVKAEIVKAWADSQPDQSAQREDLHATLRGLERVRTYLDTVIGNGKIADAIDIKRRNKASN